MVTECPFPSSPGGATTSTGGAGAGGNKSPSALGRENSSVSSADTTRLSTGTDGAGGGAGGSCSSYTLADHQDQDHHLLKKPLDRCQSNPLSALLQVIPLVTATAVVVSLTCIRMGFVNLLR